MGMAQRVGSALSTALFGIAAIALGVGPLAPTNTWALDVEGTYEGTATCTRYDDDGTVSKTTTDLTVLIDQEDETDGVSDLRFDFVLLNIGVMSGRSVASEKKPTKKGIITGVLCTNDPDSTVENATLVARVKKADKPNAKLRKGKLAATYDGGNMSCKFKATRSSTAPVEVQECPGSVDTDSVDTDSVDTDSVDTDSVDTDSVDTDSTDSADPMFGVCPGQADICAGTTLSQPWCVFGDQTVCCLPGTVPIVIEEDPLFVECIGPGI